MRHSLSARLDHNDRMLRAGIFAFAAAAAFGNIYFGMRGEHFSENSARKYFQRRHRRGPVACSGNDIAYGNFLGSEKRVFQLIRTTRYVSAILRLTYRADIGKAQYLLTREV